MKKIFTKIANTLLERDVQIFVYGMLTGKALYNIAQWVISLF